MDTLGELTHRPASGIVPYGVSDYGEHPADQEDTEKEEAVLPDANAPAQVVAPLAPWDFRAHSLEMVTVPAETDYETDCQTAQALLAQAGYAGGGGFPVVEYIYVESDHDRAVAQALQSMWQEKLGVTVTIRGLSQEEYDAMLRPVQSDEDADSETPQPATGEFYLAGQTFTAAFGDADAMLRPWHSQSETNWAGYHSKAFDILLDSADAAVSFDARDAYLHDAEAIMLTDSPVIPVCYMGGSYQLTDRLTGLYRAPNGVYFLDRVTEAA